MLADFNLLNWLHKSFSVIQVLDMHGAFEYIDCLCLHLLKIVFIERSELTSSKVP
jgi:hypothetical protein